MESNVMRSGSLGGLETEEGCDIECVILGDEGIPVLGKISLSPEESISSSSAAASSPIGGIVGLGGGEGLSRARKSLLANTADGSVNKDERNIIRRSRLHLTIVIYDFSFLSCFYPSLGTFHLFIYQSYKPLYVHEFVGTC
jgi:hypothetical protein